ncbi:hypothetical protein [Sphingomonas xinjiangensis]|uniref:Uncharacterized protein n=1 Tax=Sphingomonas xinjiangensis TaxID=643568 RepID=A0A840YSD2_9SPHN|nr:hypothetical protein [Sphingomonas xinjiangensis]MBB5712585.1 hypothetical protein [Sphingomonas xinjiangensis]
MKRALALHCAAMFLAHARSAFSKRRDIFLGEMRDGPFGVSPGSEAVSHLTPKSTIPQQFGRLQ